MSATYKKLSAASGLFFGVFVLSHLTCHYLLNVGLEVANANLVASRVLVQNPAFEAFLLLSALTHMFSNTQLYLARNKAAKMGAAKKAEGGKMAAVAGTAELKGHRMAGYFLAVTVFAHAAAARLAPMYVLDDPSAYDYGFIAFMAKAMPANILPVFLSMLGIAGGWHLIYGTRSAIATLKGSSVVGRRFPAALKVCAMASHVAVVMGVIALARSNTESDPKRDLHEKFAEAVGL